MTREEEYLQARIKRLQLEESRLLKKVEATRRQATRISLLRQEEEQAERVRLQARALRESEVDQLRRYKEVARGQRQRKMERMHRERLGKMREHYWQTKRE